MFSCPANPYQSRVCGFFLCSYKLWGTGVRTKHRFVCWKYVVLEAKGKNSALTFPEKVGHNGVTTLKRVQSGGKRGAG